MAEETKKTEKKEEKKKITKKSDRYFEGIGRRKTSSARVRVKEAGKFTLTVNDKDFRDYFYTEEEHKLLQDPFSKLIGTKWSISALVHGGGHHSQAEAVRHGIARALVKINEEWKAELKEAGFLKRDPRAKERKKFGLKKARKAAQWSKR